MIQSSTLLLKISILGMISLFICMFSHSVFGQNLVLTSVKSGLTQPMQVVNAGDGSKKIYVVEKGGKIKAFDSSFVALGTFLTLTSNLTTNGERGLISLVFHPEYATNGFFYIYFTNVDGNIEIDRYSISGDPDVADPTSGKMVLTIPHPGQSNHNGGEMHFGPDGMLYITTGDGGGGGDPANNSQDSSKLLGKLLRINVLTNSIAPFYEVPVDNPFGNEVWSRGLRNPFRWSIDPATNDFWIGDVGQGKWEEIDKVAFNESKNLNFGWSCWEGDEKYNASRCNSNFSYTFPIYQYANGGGASVTGGVVYRGKIYNSLKGTYIASDFGSGNFYKIKETASNVYETTVINGFQAQLADFGTAENGEIYAAHLYNGNIYHLTTDEVLPVSLLNFSGKSVGANNLLSWVVADLNEVSAFSIEISSDGKIFYPLTSLTAVAINYTHVEGGLENNYYRLKMTDRDQLVNYSKVIYLPSLISQGLNIYPSLITGQQLTLDLKNGDNRLSINNLTGQQVFYKSITSSKGTVNVRLPQLSDGMYIATLENGVNKFTTKLLIKN